MKGFLDYVDKDSVLHRLNPLIKILFSICICIAAFISDNYFFLLGLIAVDLLIGLMGKVFDRALSLLKGLVKISIFFFILQILFVRTGDVIFALPLGINITEDGVLLALKIVLRLISATMPLALLVSVTQMSDLSNVMVKSLGIPYKYAFTFTTAIRFIPVFSSEMGGIMEAQTARGVEFDTKNIFKKIGLVLPLCMPLLISSVKKINSGAIAAEVRGFNLRTRNSGYKSYRFAFRDFIGILVSAALVAGSILI